MCRRNQLCGFALLAFSLGLFVGTMLESGFVCFFLGMGLMGMGFWCIGKKY